MYRRLVRGSDLSPTVQRAALALWPAAARSIASDRAWLERTAFAVTTRGLLILRRPHCEPAPRPDNAD